MTRIRFLVGRLTRRERTFAADLLEPHLRLRLVGSFVGSCVTVTTVVVCFGFAAACAPAGAASARTASAAEARARCDIRIGSFPVKRAATVPGAGSEPILSACQRLQTRSGAPSNPASSSTVTPSRSAFSSLEPGEAPATT